MLFDRINYRTYRFFLSLIVLFFSNPLSVLAVAGGGTQLPNPLNASGGGDLGIYSVINRIISTFLGIIGAFALLAFVIAGIIYMTAGGEDKRVTQARDIMKYTVIGLAIIVLAYALESLFFRILGVN